MASIFDNVFLTAYFVLQYVILFALLGWYFYNKRVRRGFRVQFVAEVRCDLAGEYCLELEDVDGVKDLVILDKKDGVVEGVPSLWERLRSKPKLLERVNVIYGRPQREVLFLDDKEVKAGQDFVSYRDKAYMIPWHDGVAFREFGWEYFVINISRMQSLLFGGEVNHYYSPEDVELSLGGKIFGVAFNKARFKEFLPLFVMAVVLVGVVVAVGVYGGMTALGFVRLPENATVVLP